MNIKKIREIIEDRIRPSFWEINQLRKKSHQRYLIFMDQESLRQVESETVRVTLYREYEQEGRKVLGESTVALGSEDEIRDRLQSAWEMAGLVANPPFSLPDAGLNYPQVEAVDREMQEHTLFYLDKIREDLYQNTVKGTRLSSAEIFLDSKAIRAVNSLGLDREREETEILVEAILLAEQGDGFGGESGFWKQGRSYSRLHLAEAVREYGRFAREAQEASLPESGTSPVVFSGEALDTLFNYFVLQSSGGARFQGWSRMEVGRPILEDLRGEALTLTSNPGIPGMLKTRPFDGQGLPLSKVDVIRGNLFRQRTNNKRYADYLGEEATGDFANVEVAPGSNSLADLLGDGPLYHLLRFSTFEPNPITGAFSGEIRTGYFIRDGKGVPVRGGSVSGVIQEAFREAYFSREMTERAAYRGPAGVRLERLEIAGE